MKKLAIGFVFIVVSLVAIATVVVQFQRNRTFKQPLIYFPTEHQLQLISVEEQKKFVVELPNGYGLTNYWAQSPDGTKAVTQLQTMNGVWKLFSVDLTQVSELKPLGYGYSPVWSRDPNWVAFSRPTQNNEDELQVFIQNMVTGEEKQVTQPPYTDCSPGGWTVDNQSLIVSCTTGQRQSDLFLVNTKNGSTTPLYGEQKVIFTDPQYSHDGKFIVVTAIPQEGEPSIRVLDAKSLTTVYETTVFSVYAYTQWAPGANTLLFINAFEDDQGNMPFKPVVVDLEKGKSDAQVLNHEVDVVRWVTNSLLIYGNRGSDQVCVLTAEPQAEGKCF